MSGQTHVRELGGEPVALIGLDLASGMERRGLRVSTKISRPFQVQLYTMDGVQCVRIVECDVLIIAIIRQIDMSWEDLRDLRPHHGCSHGELIRWANLCGLSCYELASIAREMANAVLEPHEYVPGH